METAITTFENGYQLSDLTEERAYGSAFLDFLGSALIRAGVVAAEDVYNDGSLSTQGLDAAFECIDHAALAHHCESNLVTHCKLLDLEAYWNAFRALVTEAETSHQSVTTIIGMAGQISYETQVSPVLTELCAHVNQRYLYLHGVYALGDEGMLVHCCCDGGNEVIDLRWNHDKAVLPLREREFSLTEDLRARVKNTLANCDELEIEDELCMPFDLSTLINDYDDLFMCYSGS